MTNRGEIAAVIILLVASAVQVWAVEIPYICTTYTVAGKNTPDFVRNYLEKSRDSYVEWCKRDDRFFSDARAKYKDFVKEKYFSGGAVRRYGSVCEYDYRSLRFSDFPPELKIGGQGAKNYALAGKAGCPMPPSAAYASIEDITTPEFRDLTRYWDSIVSNPNKLISVLGGLPKDRFTDVYRSKIEKIAQSGPVAGLGLRVLRMRKLNDWKLFRRYELEITDPTQPGNMFLLYVDRWAFYGFAVSKLSYVAS